MPEMLPCPLLMNRYTNPAFNEAGSENGSTTIEASDDNYLDPERDYELINNLRRFILMKDEQQPQEDHEINQHEVVLHDIVK